MHIFAIFGIHNEGWNTIVVAAITVLATTLLTWPFREWVRLWAETRLHRRKADTDYEYKQRKKLREIIGGHHGRLVEAADRFNHRLVNLAKNKSEEWLAIDSQYDPNPDAQYYFTTMVYRFTMLAATADRVEREALVLDARIARPDDHAFLQFVKALRWVFTDADLFKGTGYNNAQSSDHFFTDRLRALCMCTLAENRDPGLVVFSRMLSEESVLRPAVNFFDGLAPGQLRWDRLMASQLIVMSFLNEFGDKLQAVTQDWFDEVARQIEHDQVAQNLEAWLPRFGFKADGYGGEIFSALHDRPQSKPAQPAEQA